MSRRRYVYREVEPGKVQAFEVTPDHEPPARIELSTDRHYEGLRATDGADIGSRRKHQEYMRVNGLAMAEDYKQHWDKKAQERAEFFTNGSAREHAELREDINRAAYHVEQAQRRKRR